MEIVVAVIALFLMLKLIQNSARKIAPRPAKSRPRSAPAAKKSPRVSRPTRDNHSNNRRAQTKTLMGSAWITDGDSIAIQKTQIRLYGIDAPELNHPYGIKAKWALHHLCKHQTIRAEEKDLVRHTRNSDKIAEGRSVFASNRGAHGVVGTRCCAAHRALCAGKQGRKRCGFAKALSGQISV